MVSTKNMNFSSGDVIGDYRILEELGRGGMGRVFKVEHTITRRLEAMKVLEGGRPDAPEQAARSLREIQLQASLDHPNIAAVHNAFWAGEDLILVMELIDGCSLRSLLEAGRVPLATALDYARQALSALSFAHAHAVIHRDISPANMMIAPSGVLKLTDFGLAKGPADVRVSRSGVPLGSLFYMSPEQVRGAEADARSDIYSFGAVLYELVTGKRPVEGESAFNIMSCHVDKKPVPPIEIEPNLPGSLNSVVLQSLEKDPTQRFPSAEDFLHALMQAQHRTNAVKLSPRSSISRSRVVWAATSGFVITLVIAGILASGNWHLLGKRPAAAVVHQPVGEAHVHENSAQASPATIPLATATHQSIHSQPPTETKRPANELAAMPRVTGRRASLPTPESQNLDVASAHEGQVNLTGSRTDGETTAKRGPNRLVKTLSNIWHLGRRKKSASEDDSPSESEKPDPLTIQQ